MESMFEGFSVYFLKDLAQKVNRGMTENALKCKFNGGNYTFGYIIDENKHFQIDPINAPIVADIFVRYAKGEKVSDIVKIVARQGFQNAKRQRAVQQFHYALT